MIATRSAVVPCPELLNFPTPSPERLAQSPFKRKDPKTTRIAWKEVPDGQAAAHFQQRLRGSEVRFSSSQESVPTSLRQAIACHCCLLGSNAGISLTSNIKTNEAVAATGAPTSTAAALYCYVC